jgi:hypothetical protein
VAPSFDFDILRTCDLAGAAVTTLVQPPALASALSTAVSADAKFMTSRNAGDFGEKVRTPSSVRTGSAGTYLVWTTFCEAGLAGVISLAGTEKNELFSTLVSPPRDPGKRA